MEHKSWHILIAPHNRQHFITSDNPVVIQEMEDCPTHLAGGHLYGTILLTISPKICLAFRSIPLLKQKIQLNKYDVEHINISIIKAAQRQVYSNINSNKIQVLCDKYLFGNQNKITTKKFASYAPIYAMKAPDQLNEAETLKNKSY